MSCESHQARLAQSAEHKALNLVVVGSSPTVGVLDALCSELPSQARASDHERVGNI